MAAGDLRFVRIVGKGVEALDNRKSLGFNRPVTEDELRVDRT